MPVVQTHSLEFGDITYLDIAGIIPHVRNQYYRFQLDITTPGIKVSCPYLISSLPHSLFANRETIVLRIGDDPSYLPLSQQVERVKAEHEDFFIATGLPFPTRLNRPSPLLLTPTLPKTPTRRPPLHSYSETPPHSAPQDFDDDAWTDFDFACLYSDCDSDDRHGSASHVSDSEDEYFATPIKTEGSDDDDHRFLLNCVQVVAAPCSLLTPPGHNQHPRIRVLNQTEIVNRRLQLEAERTRMCGCGEFWLTGGTRYEAETVINRNNDEQMKYVHRACRW